MIGEAWSKTIQIVGSALRGDSWENFMTGWGVHGRDKTESSHFSPDARLTDVELTNLYHHDDIAGRVVDIIPREMLRQGYRVVCPDAAAVRLVADKTRALDALKHVKAAMIWGRLFGGSLVYMGADDGQDPRMRLDETRIRSFTFLQVYDKRRAQPDTWYESGSDPKFGEPCVYRLTNYRTGGVSYVHESRLLRFGGANTGDYERWQNLGWDYSILQKVYPAIRQFATNYKAAELLMTDASQGVFKMRGLLSMIAGGQLRDLQTRAQLLDTTRSIARAVMLDADGNEDFTKIQTSFSGVGDMLDRAANRLSAAIEIPVTVLMGQAPAGLNATGASDIRTWYDKVAADRDTDLKPSLERLTCVIACSERVADRQFGIVFAPLWQETPKEKADREKVEADTAGVWIMNEVLTPETVAIARFGGQESQPYRVDPKTGLSLVPGHPDVPPDTPGAPPPRPGAPVRPPPAGSPSATPSP